MMDVSEPGTDRVRHALDTPSPGSLTMSAPERTTSTHDGGPEGNEPAGGGRPGAGVALAVGIAAGIAAWAGVEAILDSYRVALIVKDSPFGDPVEEARVLAVRINSASACYAALGGVIGLALGVTGGLSGRSARRAALAGLAGLVLGALVTGGAARGMVPVFFANSDVQSNDLFLPLLTHGVIFAAAGMAGGLSMGIGLGPGIRGRFLVAAVGGLIGAAFGAAAYEFIGALAFPLNKTHLPISAAAATRALACVLAAGPASLGAAIAVARPAGRKAVAKPDSA
jgi:hypothetical protein